MIHYRVEDLDGFVRRRMCHRIDVALIPQGPDAGGTGRFIHLKDPGENRIEPCESSTGT